MRQARHRLKSAESDETVSASPQRGHTAADWRGNSFQQISQMGTRESRGRGRPHKEQEAGKNAQLKLSKGLRSTRTTARHRVVCEGGTSTAAMRESLWKTHLAQRVMPVACCPLRRVYRKANCEVQRQWATMWSEGSGRIRTQQPPRRELLREKSAKKPRPGKLPRGAASPIWSRTQPGPPARA